MTLAPGVHLGSFEIIESIGSGGMGEVYRAYDNNLGRQVALKVLGALAEVDASQVARFRREAQFLASLDHQNIAFVFDFKESDDHKYIVMQLVEGPTLAEQLKEGPLPLKEALLIFAQIAEALDEAHKGDIIHRDLKPANLKITPDARVKVLDFGLAKFSSSEGPFGEVDDSDTWDSYSGTEEGQIIGTPAYMSPEQARGLAADKRSDIWSFGCIFFETLTGERPFKGGTVSDLVASILRSEPDWSLLPREVPPNIAQLLQRCLEKDRELRLPDISEARLEIDRALTVLSAPGMQSVAAADGALAPTESVLKVMMFTDLVDSVELKQRLGDRVGAELIARHDEIFRRCLSRSGGTEADSAGEGFFCIFDRASDALNCAFEFLRQIEEIEGPEVPAVRMGGHMGEIVRLARSGRDGGPPKYVGLAIDAASRITSLGEPRQILLTRAAFDAARQQVSSTPLGEAVEWLAHGLYAIKGLEEPVEIFEAGVAGLSPLHPPAGSERATRQVRPDEEETLGWRPATDLRIPGRPNWVLATPLGEGGFGEVWLAEQAKTHEKRVFKFCFQADRVRALKHEVVLFRLLKESLGDREDITRILDWKFDEPPYFIESEFTSGGSLTDWVGRKGGIDAVPVETRVEIVAQVAEALSAAHSVGVLHKDLKPANILIEEGAADGAPRAVLTDFGIGLITDRALLKEKGITSTGLGFTQTMFGTRETTGAGTRLFMAPEIIEGKPATTQSDIYALGIVLYQLLIGDFGLSMALGWERDIDDPLLREDIAACVEGKPDRRLSSAKELADRLRTLEERRAKREADRLTREEAARAEQLAEEARRRRRLYALVSTAGVAVTLAIAAFAYQENQRATAEAELHAEAEMARAQEEEARRSAEASQALAEVMRREAEDAQYVANIQLATLRLGQGEKDLAREALEATPERPRNWEWAYLVNQAWPPEREIDDVSAGMEEANAAAAERWDGAAGGVAAVLSGHSGFVVSLDFDSRGSRLATGSADRTAKIWDLQTGDALHTLEGHSTILAVEFSHDGRWLATGELVQNVILWDTETGERLFTFSDNGEAIEALTFSPDDAWLASHSLNGTVRIWDTETGEVAGEVTDLPAGRVPGLLMEANGRISTGLGEDSIGTWNARQGKQLFRSAAFKEPGYRLAGISRSLKFAASRHRTGAVALWDIETGEALARYDAGPNSASIPRVEISPDQSAVVTMSDDHALRIWDAESGRLLTRLPDFQIPDLGMACFNEDGSVLAVPDKDGRVRLLAPDREERGPVDRIDGHTDWVYLLRYSPDGGTLMSASYDRTIKLWSPRNGRLLATLEGHTAEPGFAAFSPDGTKLLTGAWDNTARIWDTRTGEQLLKKEIALPPIQFGGGPRGPVFSVFAGSTPYRLFGPDGERFIALTDSPNTAAVFDVETGEEHFRVSDPTAQSLYPYLLSPDGRHLLTVGYPSTMARVWSAHDGTELFHLEGHQGILTHADFSPDGTRIATTSVDGTTRIWETATGKELFVLGGHQSYSNNAHFSPSGRMLVTAAHDQTARVWDLETGEEMAVLIGHRRDVINAGFSPDETRVLTTGQDNLLKVWDLAGNELLTLEAEPTIYHAVWSPDGSSIVAGLGNGTIRLWQGALWRDLREIGESGTPIERRLAKWRELR